MGSESFRPHPPDARMLEGRNAVVTGATSGIGAAVAWELAAHGARVGVGFHSHPETAAEMAGAIAGGGGRAVPVGIDVADESSVSQGFAEAQAALGAIDLVVCNAGVEAPAALVDMSLDEWRAVIETNLTGLFLCAREAARAMTAHGRGGAIVAVTSVHDRMPWARFSHYSAAKGGQRLFVESVAKELAPQGIRVVAVAPGAIATPINQEMLDDPEAREAVEAQIAMGRIGEAGDVARAVAWIASDQASYVTGATLVVDGGMVLYPPGSG